MTLGVSTLCILLNTDLSSSSKCSPSTLPACKWEGVRERREEEREEIEERVREGGRGVGKGRRERGGKERGQRERGREGEREFPNTKVLIG